MSETRGIAVEIDQSCCSKCSICQSICPFEAIARSPETDEVKIDLQKCQVCGICYSACPAEAIEIVYYDYANLLEHMQQLRSENKSDTLVLMCRGSSPSTCEVEGILQEKRLNIENYVPLRLPCAGRVPTEFIFKALEQGVKKIVSIQCEDALCRFKEGAKVSARRLALSKAYLEQMGFDEDAVTVVKYSRKPVYETDKCVGCDKCVFVCPYDAIEPQAFATPVIDFDQCVGCGACALVCPHLAIQLKGFEFENVSKLISRYGKAAKQLKTEPATPTILVFSCQWSEFSALDEPESLLFKKKAAAIEIPCFKALDPVHVIQALKGGFDGVMAVVCAEDDCKLEKGRDTAERNLAVLRKILEKNNLLDRFEFFTSAPRCVGDFNQRLDAFIKKVASLQPLKPIVKEGTTHA